MRCLPTLATVYTNAPLQGAGERTGVRRGKILLLSVIV